MSQDRGPRFFRPSCPSGGEFFACETGADFVGCCTEQPCTANGCRDGNLKPASFDITYYGSFGDQSCPRGSEFFTCNTTDPPFMGCCKSDPCGSGCPKGDLTAAFLSSNAAIAAPFLSSSPEVPSTSPTADPSLQKTTAPEKTTAPDSGKVSPGAIAGGVVGGVTALALVVLGLVIFFYRRRKTATNPTPESLGHPGKSEPLAYMYDSPGAIHEASGNEVRTSVAKHSSQTCSPDHTPAPAYSSGGQDVRQSPPAFPAISELDSPGTPFLRHETPHQSFELPSGPDGANHPRGPIPSALSSEGLGIDFAAAQPPSPILTAPGGHRPN